jgi:hypothetical protein
VTVEFIRILEKSLKVLENRCLIWKVASMRVLATLDFKPGVLVKVSYTGKTQSRTF